jgi:hypothetical protein
MSLADQITAATPFSTIQITGINVINHTIVIDKPLKLVGSGRLSSIVRARGYFHLFEIRSTLVTFDNFALEGVTPPVAHQPGQFGIFTDVPQGGAQCCSVTRCYFGRPEGARPTVGLANGIKLNNANSETPASQLVGQWQIVDNHFDQPVGINPQFGWGYGVLLGNSSTNYIANNQFQGGSGNGLNAIYVTGGSSRNLVTGNRIDGFNSAGIALSSYTNQHVCTANTIQGNTIANQSSAFTDSGAIELAGGVMQNNICGNSIDHVAPYGIIVTTSQGPAGSADGNMIVANKINAARYVGIFLKGATHTLVLANVIEHSGVADTHYAGIHIGDGPPLDPQHPQQPGTVAAENTVMTNQLIDCGVVLDATPPSPVNNTVVFNVIVAGSVQIGGGQLDPSNQVGWN